MGSTYMLLINLGLALELEALKLYIVLNTSGKVFVLGIMSLF